MLHVPTNRPVGAEAVNYFIYLSGSRVLQPGSIYLFLLSTHFDSRAFRFLQVFSFTTWWNEKGTRQYMTMDYFPVMKTWRVQVDVPLAVNIYHRSGELLEPYDLHVGARVDCLGRVVTLHQASLDVLNWLDDQAQLLIKKKLELEDEVSKFIHVRKTTIQQTSMVRKNISLTIHTTIQKTSISFRPKKPVPKHVDT
jgi:hypothetical protein